MPFLFFAVVFTGDAPIGLAEAEYQKQQILLRLKYLKKVNTPKVLSTYRPPLLLMQAGRETGYM